MVECSLGSFMHKDLLYLYLFAKLFHEHLPSIVGTNTVGSCSSNLWVFAALSSKSIIASTLLYPLISHCYCTSCIIASTLLYPLISHCYCTSCIIASTLLYPLISHCHCTSCIIASTLLYPLISHCHCTSCIIASTLLYIYIPSSLTATARHAS